MKRLSIVLAVLLLAANAFAADLWDDRNRAVYTTRVTGAAAIATSVPVTTATGEPAGPFELLGFYLNLSAAGTTAEAFTVTLDSGGGAAYDTLAYTRDLSDGSVTDLIKMFDTPLVFTTGDQIDFAWPNTETRTYGLTILWRAKR